MNEEEKALIQFADLLEDYLDQQKVFVQNPTRMADVNAATEIACQLFPEADIELKDDPLQMGAIILDVRDFDLSVTETGAFAAMVVNANNFEIMYRFDKVELAILFRDALIRI